MKFAKLSVRHLHVLLSITVLLCGSHASAQALNRPPSDRDILPQACFAPDSIICSYALVRQVSNGRPTRTICLIEECDCYSPQGQLTGVGGWLKLWCYQESDLRDKDGRRVYPPLPGPVPFGIFPDGVVPRDDTTFAGATGAMQSVPEGDADASN